MCTRVFCMTTESSPIDGDKKHHMEFLNDRVRSLHGLNSHFRAIRCLLLWITNLYGSFFIETVYCKFQFKSFKKLNQFCAPVNILNAKATSNHLDGRSFNCIYLLSSNILVLFSNFFFNKS